MTTRVSQAKKTYRVAVVGATGAVGLEMIRMLEARHFPVKTLRLFASERSGGRSLTFKKNQINVEVLKPEAISDLDVAVFSAGATISKHFAPLFAQRGVFVIDNSSAWRMDPDVPLVVPEVNPNSVNKNTKIIANPNCSTIQMVVALKPLHDAVRVKTVRVATYQSVSGAGGKGIKELQQQIEALSSGKPIPPPEKTPHQIAYNVVPQIDIFVEGGYTKEEMKMVNETKKIMGDPAIEVSATCVRVPVFRCHSEAVWIETERPLSVNEARKLLRDASGVVVMDDPEKGVYPTPLQASEQQFTYVGRIRKDLASSRGLTFWIVSDNLLKGAALNAIQVAELLVEKGIL